MILRLVTGLTSHDITVSYRVDNLTVHDITVSDRVDSTWHYGWWQGWQHMKLRQGWQPMTLRLVTGLTAHDIMVGDGIDSTWHMVGDRIESTWHFGGDVDPNRFWRSTGMCVGSSSVHFLYQCNVWAGGEQTICLCWWLHITCSCSFQQTDLLLLPPLTGTWLGIKSGAITVAWYWILTKTKALVVIVDPVVKWASISLSESNIPEL